MNKNRNLSTSESKLITDFFALKKIEFDGLTELFHKDDETIVRYVDKKAKEHSKTFKTTEIISFVYERQRSVNSEDIMKKVSELVQSKLTQIEIAIKAEIEKLISSTEKRIDVAIKEGKEVKEEEIKEEVKETQI